jgi:RNA polymerase sigma-70 factor (ECF subfamily)
MDDTPTPETPAVTEATLDNALRAVWPGLRAYVVSMLGPHRHLADDVLQDTAIFVWEKRAELPQVRNFNAWVFRAAYFKTLSCRRDLARSKESLIGDELFERIAEAAADESGFATERRLVALQACITSTSTDERRLIDWRYRDKRPVADIAGVMKQTVNVMNQRLSRLRRSLRNCVELRLAGTEAAN